MTINVLAKLAEVETQLALARASVLDVRAAVLAGLDAAPPPAPPVVQVPATVADFTWDPKAGRAPLKVTFTNTSTGDIVQSIWDIGQGPVALPGRAGYEFEYQNAGPKHVTLAVVDRDGFTVEKRVEAALVLDPPPAAVLVDCSGPGDPVRLPVVWEHSPTDADVQRMAAAGSQADINKWIEQYIRKGWAGKGVVGIFDSHLSNTLAQTRLARIGGVPCYRFARRKRKALGDSDPINWRASQLGLPWKGTGNTGVLQAFFECEVYFPSSFNNYLNDPKLNPGQYGAMFKALWMMWGGPWNGRTPDDVSPASGGQRPDQQSDWSIRMQCNTVGSPKGKEVSGKTYAYIMDRPAGATPTTEDETYGFGSRYGPPFKRDGWSKVRCYVRLNSIKNDKAVYDGVLRFWIDDVLVADYRDLNIRGTKTWHIQGSGICLYNGGDNSKEYHLLHQDSFIAMRQFRMGC